MEEHLYAVYVCRHGQRHTWRGCEGKCDGCCAGIVDFENKQEAEK